MHFSSLLALFLLALVSFPNSVSGNGLHSLSLWDYTHEKALEIGDENLLRHALPAEIPGLHVRSEYSLPNAFGMASAAQASEWSASMTFRQGSREQQVTFGMKVGATNDFDAAFDVALPPLPPAAGYLRAALYRPDWNHVLGTDFGTEYRAVRTLAEVPERYVIRVLSRATDSVRVSLAYPAGLDVPFTVRLGERVWHLRGNGTFAFMGDANGTYLLEVEVGDRTAPVVGLRGALTRPYIFEAEKRVDLELAVVDSNRIAEILVEYSLDQQVWTRAYVGTSPTFTWEVPDTDGVSESLVLRAAVTDVAGNTGRVQTTRTMALASPRQTLSYGAGWQMVAYPFASMREAQAGEGVRYGWQNDEYREVTAFAPGFGYWLGALATGSDALVGDVSPEGGTQRIPAGWHLIGSPLLRTISLDSVVVARGTESLSLAAAVSAGWVTMPHAYTGEAYVEATAITPFVGYWVGVSGDPVDVTLPVHDRVDVAGKTLQEDLPQWALHVSDEGRIQTLGISFHRAVPAPPPAPGRQPAGFLGEETVLGNLYLTTRATEDTEVRHPLVFAGAEREITLSWPDQPVDDVVAHLHAGERRLNLARAGTITVPTSTEMYVITQPASATSAEGTDLVGGMLLHPIYPNPARTSVQVAWELAEPGSVSLAVYDVLGRQMLAEAEVWTPAGRQERVISLAGYPAGLYTLVLRHEGHTTTQTLVVLR